ncbi:MAG TPA: hypothetical protein VKY71_00860 [Actinotalea caeni]|nr:hypothetical protein [Actinotalea caeni]HLV54103.1 hypothetical protein [Actinotalea caeni]
MSTHRETLDIALEQLGSLVAQVRDEDLSRATRARTGTSPTWSTTSCTA